MRPKVAVYARISFDDESTGLGVQRQEEDARMLCGRLGWDVAGVYRDNNLSAFRKGVRRPSWEDLLIDLAAGAVQGIAAYDLDRIARQPRDLERLIEIYDEHPGLVFATVTGEIDLSKPDGLLMARIMVSFASKSSSDTGRRVSRAKLQIAQMGKVAGGGYRPYGFEKDRRTIVEAEAANLRDIAERALRGQSMRSIARQFDAQGIPTPAGREHWSVASLTRILTSPRIAGLRGYKGTLLLGDNGHPVKAVWPAIINMDTWTALKELLTNPDHTPKKRIDRAYLLSGFLYCRCGAKMSGAMRKGRPEYRCNGCGNTHRLAAPIDEFVTGKVLNHLEAILADDDLAPIDEDDDLDQRIAEAEASLAALINEWTAGRISDQVFFTAQNRKEAVVLSLRRERGNKKRRQTSQASVGVRERWEQATLSERRAILSEVLQGVRVIAKWPTQPRSFDPSLYRLTFRTD
ncbi:recombinase family protein [Pseudarthrobacter oxydans]|uniref:recombinase family protein n=1 Tax=Pseudarthrobacter oxydans TaxID=1671 RepID=UPI0035E78069|nr:hypothetical protein GCM10017547_38860 [Pseudarthrobacter oxydans]